jgi:hypothetical protein
MTYELIKNGVNGIKCHICEKPSYNVYDLANLYCGYCKYFHHAEMEGVNEQVFKDLFGNVVIYDMSEGNQDVWEMHDNVRSGKWLVYLVALDTDSFTIDFIESYRRQFDVSMLAHETGNNGVMFISQQPEKVDLEKFKRYYSIVQKLR